MIRTLVLALLSPMVAAAAPVKLVLHPVYGPALSAKHKDLLPVVDDAARNTISTLERFKLVNEDAAAKALQASGGECPYALERRLPCLEQLARGTGAVYAVELELRPEGSNSFQLIGNIAAHNQAPLKQPEPIRIVESADVKLSVAVERQVKVLLTEKLNLAALPEDPPLPVQPNPNVIVVAPPNPEPVPVAPKEDRGGLRVVGWTGAVVAVGCGVAAGLFAAASGTSRAEIDARHQGQPRPLTLYEQDLPAYHALRTHTALLTAFGIAAGVLAVTSVAVLLYAYDVTGSNEPAPSMQVQLGVGLGNLVLTGRF